MNSKKPTQNEEFKTIDITKLEFVEFEFVEFEFVEFEFVEFEFVEFETQEVNFTDNSVFSEIQTVVTTVREIPNPVFFDIISEPL